jgi:type IV secretion system protein VirB9
MMATPLIALVALSVSTAPSADARVHNISYRSGETFTLKSSEGSTVTIILEANERVLQADAADAEAFDIVSADGGGTLFVRMLRTPTDPSIVVRTHLRTYRFAVQPGPADDATNMVRFSYGVGSGMGYKISGEKALRPVRVSDDGLHTYLEWSEEQALPAVFAVNALGDEEMVDGYMRSGIFTIDRVHGELVFRIGKKFARAERLGKGGKKP